MNILLTCIALCVACLTASAGDSHGVATEALAFWHGVPVTLIHNGAGEDDTFSIVKQEPTDENEYGTIDIVSGTDAGLMYGVFTILRAQAMGDGCLCRTVPDIGGLTVEPRFTRRVAMCDWNDLKIICDTGRIADFAENCAKAGFNMLNTTRPEGVSKREFGRLMKNIKPVFMKYRIIINEKEGDDVNVAVFDSETGPDGVQFMAEEWYEKMAQLEMNGVTTVIMPIRRADDDHPFIEANNYAFGRMSMDREATPYLVAYEWLTMNYTENPLFVMPMREIMINGSETEFNTKRKAFETYVNN